MCAGAPLTHFKSALTILPVTAIHHEPSVNDLRLDDEATLAWQAAQDLDAQRMLQALPAFAEFRDRIAALHDSSRVAVPVRHGDLWFSQAALDPSHEQLALVVGATPHAADRVLVDPNALSAEAGTLVSIAGFAPSPDGSLLAYAVQRGGAERSSVHVLDVATGEELPEDLPYEFGGTLRWLEDNGTLWMSTRDLDGVTFSMALREHRLGEAAAPAESLPADAFYPQPLPTKDGRWVMAVCGNTEVRAAQLRHPDGVWRPFLADVAGGTSGTFMDETWVAILDGDDARGRLVRIPLASSEDRSTWQELLPVSDEVLRYVARVGDDLLVVGFLKDCSAGLRVIRADGSIVDDLQLPGAGTINGSAFLGTTQLVPMVVPDAHGFTFLFSSFSQSWTSYRWEPESGLREVDPPQLTVDGLQVDLVEAVSTDGTRVTAHVLRRADRTGEPLPALVHGYGGFNVGLLPGFKSDAVAWAQAGGAYVLTHLRGGSEQGRTWWAEGRMGHKQNTFNDLYAVAEELKRSGIASALAVHGGSNGGLLTGVALTQRPKLWDAVVCEVPVLDLLELEAEPLTAAVCAGEYGSAQLPEQRAWLEAYSPLQNVHDGTAYPPLLVISGRNDPRCPPRHGRQFAARVRQASSSSAPTILRVPADQGHGAQARSAAVVQHAEMLAFVAEHVRLR
jgi:prolyl oligopeptidase